MTALVLQIDQLGIAEVLAISENERELELEMFKYCEEREIVPEYKHGEYCFRKETVFSTGNKICGWFRYQQNIKVI